MVPGKANAAADLEREQLGQRSSVARQTEGAIGAEGREAHRLPATPGEAGQHAFGGAEAAAFDFARDQVLEDHARAFGRGLEGCGRQLGPFDLGERRTGVDYPGETHQGHGEQASAKAEERNDHDPIPAPVTGAA